MLPESRDKRVNYEVKMPSPPQPRRRGAMEFYEWITLLLFLMSLTASTIVHLDIDPNDGTGGIAINEETNSFHAYPDAITAFFFLLLVIFDYDASRRYTKYSSQLFDQWQEDKIRLMKTYSEGMEKKAKAISKDNDSK